MFKAAVVTVSDRCSRGERTDEGGPLVAQILKDAGFDVVKTVLVPDDKDAIARVLSEIADRGEADLVATTGGTGFAPRDITPEATLAVCQRLCPGIPEAMRAESLKITPRAMLSRAQAGIRESTLIINLPGSPRAAKENLEAVISSLDHGLTMLQGESADCARIKD